MNQHKKVNPKSKAKENLSKKGNPTNIPQMIREVTGNDDLAEQVQQKINRSRSSIV